MKLDYLCTGLDIADDEQAIEIFRTIRWANGVYCPKCKTFETIMAGGGGSGKPYRYICKKCNNHFNDLTETIFHGSHISLGEVFYVLLNLNNKNIKQISEELGCSRQAIHRISKIFNNEVEKQTERKRNL
ncbi:MAG: transposase [Methanobrevibacter sp.]|nr:transposase [Methanobrevibacter sp.]